MPLPSQLLTVLAHDEFLEQTEALKVSTSLSQMVYIVLQMGLFLARCLLEDELSRRAKAVFVWPVCTTCGTRLHSKGWESRQMQTLVGTIS
ncbi:hypothetical protein HRE53_33200 (plasmid) [Acaryochloris sp. 'Moss Beach']|uniref:hypothetical protein n=2 Tax=Acaryochloris TaxID=155977 RepID=UPI001BB05CD2|nr:MULTISPECIES: hypothetical protein [Acaryochloris]QUY40377.1 hypothetical protein I1H34_00190 [Acaryochloris marina S15]QUY45875.1 hypothetical protein I1H34_29525 [Acaryochloris marina S15]UJB67793.1 hypothetical protein HRE53_14070 [Acaryochloris sp. 'Moss Beach']UJB68551.1 hypothetical protein HRE53_18825 [Acaryochloris sp. 'Moss Beach']UJB72424.1 hypothetical protein HRE53_26275 [Acaryochloris sp. 'Moss Beach']